MTDARVTCCCRSAVYIPKHIYSVHKYTFTNKNLLSCTNSPFGDGAYGFGPWRRWLTPARSLPRCELPGSYTLNLAQCRHSRHAAMAGMGRGPSGPRSWDGFHVPPREAGDHWLSGTKGTSGGRGAGPALFCGSRLCLIRRGGGRPAVTAASCRGLHCPV